MLVEQHIGDNTAVEFLEGTLSEPDQARVEAHAARCHDCRQHLAALGRMESQDDQVPTAPLGEEAHIALERGEKVGQFEILSRIGSGGMGVVFAAYDPRLGRKVALKLLRSPKDSGLSVSDAQRRFLREAQAMAQLSHPNVIAVYDVGRYKSEVYIAMELVEGETLTRWLRRWKRPWRDILDKFLAAGTALAEAHGSGLAHRDFKPDNVLVGSDERVRVMDFGLVRSLFFDAPPSGPDGHAPRAPQASMLGHALTRTGALMGTPRYMAPEQLAGQDTEARSDQFSFCVALYEALYDQHPFEGDTAAGMGPDSSPRPPPPTTEVPSWLHSALVRGLSFKAKDRFPTMRDLLRAITPPPLRPSRTRLAIATSMLGVAFLYVIAAWLQARSQSEQLGSEVSMAHARVAKLEQEVKDLLLHVQQLEGRTGTQQAVIDALEQRLSAASAELAQAELVLNQQAGAVGGPVSPGTGAPALLSGNGTGAVPRPQAGASGSTPGPARLRPQSGLTRDELMAPLDPFQHDIHVCMREWLERVPEERLLLGVRLRIEPGGVPAVGKIGGIEDHVMRQCVTGNLLRLRFPARDVVTVADYKFLRDADGALATAADVAEVLPPAPAGGAP